jgi:hypothetical protein
LTRQRDNCYHQDAIIAGRPSRVNEVFSGGYGCIVGPEVMDSWFALNKVGKRMALPVEAKNGIA